MPSQDSRRPLVRQAEDGSLRATGVGFELTALSIDRNGRLASECGYLQVAVERADGILRDDIALLLLHRERQSAAQILVHQSARGTVTSKTGEARSQDKCEEHC